MVTVQQPYGPIAEWIIALVLGVVHGALVYVTNTIVPEPYMDEIFHIGQTRRYCVGDWSWDPKITTPPLLYILGMPLCGGWERYLNSLILPVAYLGCCRLRRLFAPDDVLLPSLSVLLLPVLLHSSILFYTDLLSVCLLVWALSTRSTLVSALLFAVSLFARQTNIVWAGLYAGVCLFRRLRPGNGNIFSPRPLLSLTPFILLALAFLAFVHINGGIVLGDPSAHQPQVHFAQFLYLTLFISASAWPQFLTLMPNLSESVRKPVNFIILAIILAVIKQFTLSHPYLLADNRHIPFYLWRWVLARPSFALALLPVYGLALLFITKSTSHIAPILRVLFLFATIAVVVPAHLIEFRYFIVPYILWRLALPPNTRYSLFLNILEIVSHVGVFSFVFYLFLFKPFEWAHEPGTQRFMW